MTSLGERMLRLDRMASRAFPGEATDVVVETSAGISHVANRATGEALLNTFRSLGDLEAELQSLTNVAVRRSEELTQQDTAHARDSDVQLT